MEKTKGITNSELKYIAILAMLLDHIAVLFIPSDTLLHHILIFIGRITAPVMCFFITEGYHYTRNLKKYFIRLAVFAVISHFAYAFAFTGSFFGNCTESMISTLFLCLLSVHVVHLDKLNTAYKLIILIAIARLADKCDWGAEAVVYTLAFELARGNRKTQLKAYALAAVVFNVIPLIKYLYVSPSFFVLRLFTLGVFLPIPLLLLYNGEKGGGRFTKWTIYIFYPAHLLLLGYIDMRYS